MERTGQKQCSYLDEYRIVKTLGSGYHAIVKLAEDPKGQLVAIKQYKQETSDMQTLIDELSIMKNLNQQNIVKLIAVRDVATFQQKDGITQKCFAIVLQYCSGGQLFDFICETGKFSEKVTRTYFHQMMSGLFYIHQKGYAHRDIKPENLLISGQFKLKIADFGFSCLWKGKDGTGVLHTKLGTEGYMAPQIYAKNYDGKQTDVFAAGIILFVMYAGCPPFERTNESDPYFKLLKGKQFDKFWKYHERKRTVGYFSEGFRSLFIHMTAIDPKQRPKIQQIANHPWVKQQLCTHGQIKAEFCKRKQYLDQMLQIRFQQSQQENKLHLHEISTQAESQNRSQVSESPFVEIYNKEIHAHRKLPQVSARGRDSLTIREKTEFAISVLKNKLKTLIVPVLSQEENIVESQPGTAVLTFLNMQDNGNENIEIKYSYNYGTQKQFKEIVEIKLELGLDSNSDLVVNFSKIQGNFFYYKKILTEIRIGLINKL